MKRIALALAALTFAASTAMAYVQPGHALQTQSQTVSATPVPDDDQGATSVSESGSFDPGSDVYRRRPGNRPPSNRPPDGATRPVPEPGTMMLASMGLLALGAAMRHRRH